MFVKLRSMWQSQRSLHLMGARLREGGYTDSNLEKEIKFKFKTKEIHHDHVREIIENAVARILVFHSLS